MIIAESRMLQFESLVCLSRNVNIVRENWVSKFHSIAASSCASVGCCFDKGGG